jgi:CHASE3 domain sensor protein
MPGQTGRLTIGHKITLTLALTLITNVLLSELLYVSVKKIICDIHALIEFRRFSLDVNSEKY